MASARAFRVSGCKVTGAAFENDCFNLRASSERVVMVVFYGSTIARLPFFLFFFNIVQPFEDHTWLETLKIVNIELLVTHNARVGLVVRALCAN